jgi:hypothetical protein
MKIVQESHDLQNPDPDPELFRVTKDMEARAQSTYPGKDLFRVRHQEA